MRKIASLAPFCFLLFFAIPALAQQHQPHPAPQHVNKYKKKEPPKNIYAVDTLIHPIPINRSLFHDNIDKEQAKADLSDHRRDTLIRFQHDSAKTQMLTQALLYDVDTMQIMIENMPANGRDPVMDNQQRIRCLRAVWEMLRHFNGDPRPDPEFYRTLSANMHDMIIAANENKLMEFAVTNTDIYTLDNGMNLTDNHPDVRAYLYREMGKADPVMMIKRLEEFAKDTFASNIIRDASRLVPDLVFNYATSSNSALRTAVFSTRDPFVQAIVKIANESKSPVKAFPLISDIYHHRLTMAEVDTLAAHPDLYFQELVRLKMINDSVNRKAYLAELEYRALKYYVRQMNELHEEKENIRFACIDSLPPTSLYYILVYGQDEIYTSSFVGTFKRLLERMKPMKGDQLLDTLHRDRFRTFIRMCAGYNTLSDFLATTADTASNALMNSFISGLQRGKDDDLEDAVDVADAIGSIRDSALSAFLQFKVRENYEQSYRDKSKKGMIVYSLLAMLIEGNRISGSDTGASVASSRLHLPPINKVPYRDLVNDSGIVYQQLFFFGDKDGQDSYDSYMSEFKNDKNWKVTNEQYWTTISSVTGKKVVIYANLPLKEPEDEDAQSRLCKFLSDSGIVPAIVIHRGHSYHLPVTLEHLTPQTKIVILGSCGGYHNLATVLDHAPNAHIISSKQTGARAVNEPIIKSLNNRLLEGADVNWIAMWRELEERFAKNPAALALFDDYVPPYKNLGAIFIKAYRKMMNIKPQNP